MTTTMKRLLPEVEALQVNRVLAAERKSSTMPVIVDTDAGPYFVKLHGTAQGKSALVAEVIVAELAEALDLDVPERRLIMLGDDVISDDKNDELADLLNASRGLNLGFHYMKGARDIRPDDIPSIDEDIASRIVWLDALVMNMDRTARNPNLLLWMKKLWLIDHGASLPFQYNWNNVTEESPRRRAPEHHVLESRATRVREWDPILAQTLTRDVLTHAVDCVPDEFLNHDTDDVSRRRAAYVAYLWKRLKDPRPFIHQP